jgi:GGDEF domain-containing protein
MVITNQSQALAAIFDRLHNRVRAQTEGFKGLAPYVADIMGDLGAKSATLYLLREGLKGTSGQGTLTHSFTLKYEDERLEIHSSGQDIDLGLRTSFIPAVYALDKGLRFLKVGEGGIREYSTDISDHFGTVFQLPIQLTEQIVAPLYVKDRDHVPNRLGVLTISGENLMLDLLKATDMDPIEQTRHTMLYLSMLSSGISTIISSRVDPLTTLPRRGEFEIKLRTAIDLFQQGKIGNFSVALMDIDHFKSVNDSHGHLNGDIVLQQVATTASNTLRTKKGLISENERRGNVSQLDQTKLQDFFARWGGEEFIALITSDAPGAKIATERIRKKIEGNKMSLSDDKSIGITVSFGIASIIQVLQQGASTIEEMVERIVKAADAALYTAKAAGRNQSRIFGQD